ncbi:hypothetical protein PR202_gn00717 [Eleusine coracana subsp. coracana]|uniref:Transposase (putative) gypsy type domain-containing protein n=1 Tax=Eleusine coracana subsp. coracana TaxID=191504 RepID=A0AAV5G081_ELECO|nr:hypothetical protein PR202_gn00717 [Eleusine coracana subsp. coracana]
MATRSRALPLLVLSLAAVALTADAAGLGDRGRSHLLGGWNLIQDVGDAAHQELGGWALGQAEQDCLASEWLQFRRVVRGEQQVVSGTSSTPRTPSGRVHQYWRGDLKVWLEWRRLEDNLTIAPERLGHDHDRDPLKEVEDDEEEDNGDEEEEDEEEDDEEEGGTRIPPPEVLGGSRPTPMGKVRAVRGARLAGQEVTPCPAQDEAVVFEDHFTAGLLFPCSSFVKDVLGRFNVQLHHISPSEVAKFAWGVLSYQGQPDIEIFCKYYCAHYQPKTIKIDGVVHEADFGCATFMPRFKRDNQFVKYSRNRWGDKWHESWLVPKGCKNDVAFRIVTFNSSGRDLVEEFVAANKWPLREGCSIPGFIQKKIPSRPDITIPFPEVPVDKRGFGDEEFVVFLQRASEAVVGPYTREEHKHTCERTSDSGRLNHVLTLAGVKYPARVVPGPRMRQNRPPGNVGSDVGKAMAAKKARKEKCPTKPLLQIGKRKREEETSKVPLKRALGKEPRWDSSSSSALVSALLGLWFAPEQWWTLLTAMMTRRMTWWWYLPLLQAVLLIY